MQVAIEAIYNAIQTAIYSLLLFSMIGFDWKATNFFWFYYYMFMSFMYFTLYGMMIVALTPGHQVAAICMSFFLSFWNLFSGFIIPRVVSDLSFSHGIHNLISSRNDSRFLDTKLILFVLNVEQQIPVWWRWYYWASPVSWTLYGLITSQLGDRSAELEIPGNGTMELKEYLKQNFGFQYDFLPVVAAVHVGWVLLFLFVFAYGIKFLNFQKR